METKNYFSELSSQPEIAQLQQLTCLTFDGDLISKDERDKLYKKGYIRRVNGWNIIHISGIQYLESLQFIHP